MARIQDVVTKFLTKIYQPQRFSFSIEKGIDYRNHLFKCSRYGNGMSFSNNEAIRSPGTFIASILSREHENMRRSVHFDLEITGDHVRLDTMGKIPARNVHMLKDFYFKTNENVIIDSDSLTKIAEIEEYWHKKVNECNENILKNILFNAVNLAENQKFRFKVIEGPCYFENKEWYTCDHNHSPAAKLCLARSTRLYSIGNTDIENRFRYQELFASGGGIHMSYAKMLPWHALRQYTLREIGMAGSGSSGYLDTRGSDTYDQRKDLSVEELVVLYEYLKSEGAVVKLLYVNGIKVSESKL
jgi:hypothetical protein